MIIVLDFAKSIQRLQTRAVNHCAIVSRVIINNGRSNKSGATFRVPRGYVKVVYFLTAGGFKESFSKRVPMHARGFAGGNP